MIVCQIKQLSTIFWNIIDSGGTASFINTSMSKYTQIEPFLLQDSTYQTELIINNIELADFATYECVNSLNQSAQVNLTQSKNNACVIPVCLCINVTWVSCSGIGIVNLDEHLFAANPTLVAQIEWLDLSHNQFVYVNSEIFKKFVNLVHLDLSFNAINIIDSNSFKALSNLNVLLDLSFNQLDVINVNTFTGLTSLKQFFLRSNNVKSIDENSFLSLSKLEQLDLSSNKLTAIKASTLNGLESLQKLSLQANQITSFDLNALSNLTNLRELNLNGNVFDTIYYDTPCLGKFAYFSN